MKSAYERLLEMDADAALVKALEQYCVAIKIQKELQEALAQAIVDSVMRRSVTDGTEKVISVRVLDLVSLIDTPSVENRDHKLNLAWKLVRESLAKAFPERFTIGENGPVYSPEEGGGTPPPDKETRR